MAGYNISVVKNVKGKEFYTHSDVLSSLSFHISPMPGCCGFTVLNSFTYYKAYGYTGPVEQICSDFLMQILLSNNKSVYDTDQEFIVIKDWKFGENGTYVASPQDSKAFVFYRNSFGFSERGPKNFILTDAINVIGNGNEINDHDNRTYKFYKDTKDKYGHLWFDISHAFRNPNTIAYVFTMLLSLQPNEHVRKLDI